jgi:hypothetical protein
MYDIVNKKMRDRDALRDIRGSFCRFRVLARDRFTLRELILMFLRPIILVLVVLLIVLLFRRVIRK